MLEEINMKFPADNVHRCGLGYSKSTIRSCVDPFKQLEDREQLTILFKQTKLTDQQRQYLKLYFIEDMTARSIGDLYGRSQTRVIQVIHESLQKLWKKACLLKMEGLSSKHPHFRHHWLFKRRLND